MSIDRCPACDYKFTWREKNGYLNTSKTPQPCPACKALLVLNKRARSSLRAFHGLMLAALIMNGAVLHPGRKLSDKWFAIASVLFFLVSCSWLTMLLVASASKRLEVVERNIPPTALKIVTPHDGREASGRPDLATPD